MPTRASRVRSLGPTMPPNHTDFYSGALAFDQLVVNADLSRPVDVGLAGPLNVALGVEVNDAPEGTSWRLLS